MATIIRELQYNEECDAEIYKCIIEVFPLYEVDNIPKDLASIIMDIKQQRKEICFRLEPKISPYSNHNVNIFGKKPEYEFRTLVHSNTKRFRRFHRPAYRTLRSTNFYVGNEGQLNLKYKNNKNVAAASSVLIQLPTQHRSWVVLTCAHNFINYSETGTLETLETALFYHEQTKDKNDNYVYADMRQIKEWRIHQNYPPDCMFNDIAIASINSSFNTSISSYDLCSVEEAKPGDRICIVGYPQEYGGILCFMEGFIHQITYKDEKREEAVIYYSNIITSDGQSGSPVFLKEKQMKNGL